jgi:16S rRNA pseudouridine516 synthase
MKPLAWDKLLQSQGFGSRRACQQLIEAGAVSVAGVLVEDYRQTVATPGLVYRVDGEDWLFREKLYLALNKPPHYECSRKPSHHPGVLSLLPAQFRERDVQPVGRLDHDTTGLLLLSDDGAFIHAQSSPKRQVPKVYLASTEDPVDSGLVDTLLRGVKLHDETMPLAATHCTARASHAIEIIVEQGKYHQVKRMLAAAGNHCTSLQRTSIGGLTLESLALDEGQWCYLDEAALSRLAQVDYPVTNAGHGR